MRTLKHIAIGIAIVVLLYALGTGAEALIGGS
jgi:hypothetical protein